MCPTYMKERHDCGILRSDLSTKVGLMLATIEGKPAYRTSTERYLKNQYYAGAPDYGALDPQSELPIILDDWRAGYGLEVAASADPTRYYSSIGMDLRHRGMAIAGWTPTTVTLPTTHITTYPLLSNRNMEAGTTSWTGATADTAKHHSGSVCIKKTNGNIDQSVSNWTNDWQGKTFTLSTWYMTDGGTGGQIGITDGAGTTYSGNLAATAWAYTTISRTLDGGASELTVRLKETAASANFAYFDNVGIHADYVTQPVAFADFNDELYMAIGNVLTKCNTAGDEFTKVDNFPAVITDLEPFIDHLGIACGTADTFWYADTAEALLESTDANAQFQFFATVHGATPTLYGNDGVNTIRSATSITASTASTAWSGTTTVGSSYHDITDLISWKGLLYIMKEDKPYYLDATPAIQDDLARELESAQKSTSGKNAWLWKNELHIPCGDQALLHTDGTTNSFINPSKYCTNLTDFAGRVYAGAGDEEWNYVVVENASTTEVEVMATRLETIDGTTSRVWHPIAEITLKGCECCHISTEVSKRLWIASDDATDSLYYLPLPTTYGDIINDSNKKFKDGVSFITSGQHGGFKGENKYWRKATATLGHSYDADVYYELHFMRLGDGDYSDPADGGWVDVGDFKGSSTNMSPTLYFPANTEGVSPVTPMMWFKLVAQSNTSTDLTPELLSLDIRAILKPTHRKIIECAVRCADGILDRDGHRLEGTSAAYIRTVLDEARDATSPFTFYDPWGASHTCTMLPNDPESTMQTDLKNENPEQFYFLRMQEETIA